MTRAWQYRPVGLKFRLSDKTLFAVSLGLQVADAALGQPVANPAPPGDGLETRSQGFLIRALPLALALPVLIRTGRFYRYAPFQYRRYFIDLRLSFAEYQRQFPAKSRATILRKCNKYAEYCGGALAWKVYREPDQMADFFELARAISAKTCQDRLRDAGLPQTPAFCAGMDRLARAGLLRAFILFHGGRPVSYLYCPIQDGVLLYRYMGCDPAYLKWSVGTVLQWLALEHLFGETRAGARLRLFDFTEGESEHKRLFATHSVRCANIFFLRAGLRNWLLLHAHRNIERLSRWSGAVQSQIRRWIRLGWSGPCGKL